MKRNAEILNISRKDNTFDYLTTVYFISDLNRLKLLNDFGLRFE